MMDFALKSGDLQIINGDIALCENDTKATAQAITIRLKTLASEWFMDQNVGIPYLNQVLGKKRNDRFMRRLITKELQDIQGIKKISGFNFKKDAEKRGIIINFQVTLSDRTTITINESIGV